jgi:hypothetical protein
MKIIKAILKAIWIVFKYAFLCFYMLLLYLLQIVIMMGIMGLPAFAVMFICPEGALTDLILYILPTIDHKVAVHFENVTMKIIIGFLFIFGLWLYYYINKKAKNTKYGEYFFLDFWK